MEDGEIQENVCGVVYHPALEWSGNDTLQTSEVGFPVTEQGYDSSRALPPSSSPLSVLRLLVKSTFILPQTQKLAILDGYAETHFGRDAPSPGTDIPRIRLKEMEVSKLHATVYWDQDRLQWAVVDMGSKHGTFIQAPSVKTIDYTAASSVGDENPDMIGITSPVTGAADPRGMRLSAPRVASMPRRLRHLDELSIGGTTFIVHIHVGRLPCEDCSPRSGEEIPLFDLKRIAKEKEALKRKREALETPNPFIEGRDPKKALTMLKKSLLSRHGSPTAPDPSGPAYVDRSARRRALHPSAPDIPAIESSTASTPSSHRSSPTPAPVISAPPVPVPSTNIGHRLLMKQGWQPGTTLGQSSADTAEGTSALLEPIQVSQKADRVGLGMVDNQSSTPISSGLSWKEEGKRRRWSNITTMAQARR